MGYQPLPHNEFLTPNERRKYYNVVDEIIHRELMKLKHELRKSDYENAIFNRIRYGDVSEPVVSEMLRILQERGEL